MIEIARDPPGGLADVMTVMSAAFEPRYGEAWTEAQCSGVLAMPGTHLLVARAPDPVGFALMRTVFDEAELMLLAVLPARRGCGIGHRLLEQSFGIADEQAVTTYFLEVRDGNPAVTFYAAHGLVQIGVRRDYYKGLDGKRRDALTFRKILR
jgi:[ribosomal protein S18]-alanine N-acetyltransferase